MKNVLWLENIDSNDISKVGVEGAHLGEVQNIDVPTLPGFVTTTDAYKSFIRENNLRDKIETLLHNLDLDDVSNLQRASRQIRGHIREADMPESLRKSFIKEYNKLGKDLGVQNPDVRVSPSRQTNRFYQTGVDKEVYFNVSGKQELIKRIKDCYASLFTNSAISYRKENEISHLDMDLSVVIQEMKCSDPAASGTMNTIEPNTQTKNILSINAGYGLENYIKNKKVDADNFKVFKESIGIVDKNIGDKKVKLVEETSENDTRITSKKVPLNDRKSFCITDNQVKELSKYGLRIENHYNQPMNIEWMLDAKSNQIYILGANPNSKQQEKDGKDVIEDYKLHEESQVLLQGESVGNKIKSGTAHILSSPRQIDQFEKGEILIIDTTDPNWEPLIKEAGAIITNRANSHAKKISREHNTPAIVGTKTASSQISDGQKITVDCSSHKGKIWEGHLEYSIQEYQPKELQETEANIQINIRSADEAFYSAQQPVDSTAKADLNSMLRSEVGEHPLNLIKQNKEDEYIKAVRSSIGKVGGAFYPQEAVICLSDFRAEDENFEEWDRYSNNKNSIYQQAFELECKGMRKAIDGLRLDNIAVMVPLCRTVKEGRNARARIKEHGLDQGEINVYMRAEAPSNVINGEDFAELFDGISIRTSKLSKITLGISKEIDKIGLHNERNPSIKESVKTLISKTHNKNKHVNVEEYDFTNNNEYLRFLANNKVDSITVNPENALETVSKISELESNSDIYDNTSPVSSQKDIGSAAGHIYDLLSDKGKTTVNNLKKHSMPVLDEDLMHQALGWLAREGKIELEVKKNGEVKYQLN